MSLEKSGRTPEFQIDRQSISVLRSYVRMCFCDSKAVYNNVTTY